MVAQRQELILAQPSQPILWDDAKVQEEIRLMFAPTLSAMEFKLFIALGKATGLNPYLKEIWAVKYDGKAAQIFIGRDGYRKGAQRQPSYDYHFADAVYENDEFSVDEGKIKHKYSLKDRGALIGAYCEAKRKGSSKAHFSFVELKEYSTGKALWRDANNQGKPCTMIKKVAEAQTVRSCWQEVFAGTYHEYEQFEQPLAVIEAPSGKGMGALEKALNIEAEEVEPIEAAAPDSRTAELKELISRYSVTKGSITVYLKRCNAKEIEDLSDEQISKWVNHLKSTKEKV